MYSISTQYVSICKLQTNLICSFGCFPVVQESLKSELERETKVRLEVEEKLQEREQSLQRIQTKSNQLISGLQQKLEEQTNAKVC